MVKLQRGRWGGGEDEIFKRVLLAFREQKTCLQVSSFLVFKLSVLRNEEMRPCRENEKGSELGVMTRQLRCLFVLSVRLFVIDAASPGG